MNPYWAGYNAERSKDFYRELLRRVRSWPEVQSASLAFSVPLGATPQDILSNILRGGLLLVIAGIGIGLAGAAALTRLLSRFLLLVSATDPLTFVAVTSLLAFVSLFACYLPARRATRVEPVVALRHE